MKKVSDKQIELLYEFTRKHYVEYYDVQTELVDHLANAIETHCKSAPNDSFEEVLQKEFRKFGVFGFMDVVEAKTKQMTRHYYKILWQKIGEFYTLPKVILTLFITALIYCLLYWVENKEIVMITLSAFLIVSVFLNLIKESKKQLPNGKKWLFQEIITKLNGTNTIILIFVQTILNIRHIPNNKLFLLIYALIFSLFAIFTYLSKIYLPKNSEKYLAEVYPEYRLKIA